MIQILFTCGVCNQQVSAFTTARKGGVVASHLARALEAVHPNQGCYLEEPTDGQDKAEPAPGEAEDNEHPYSGQEAREVH